MPRKNKPDPAGAAHAGDAIASIKYPAKRKNIPPAGLEAQGRIQETPKIRHEYNPHLPPVLRSATDAAEADKLPELLAMARKRPLTDEEARTLADALRRHEPWLEWSGKREKPWFEVEPVALHMHERISTQAILRVLAREDVERDLFADPQHDYAKAVQFYQHDVDWANRMILGDSLQVMASLARREDLAGKVQMIYLDPPYGIKFASNFQPQLGQRDVKDREQDLTREPEMVKAYRDTWTLGIHSYLAYLRDRLQMARELLTDSGSIFVQISDENLHRVRCVMDEVFGAGNLVASIVYSKTSSATANLLPNTADYILWFAKDKTKAKYQPIFSQKVAGGSDAEKYDQVVELNGHKRPLRADDLNDDADAMPDVFRLDNITSQSIGREKGEGAACWFPVNLNGRAIRPTERNRWKTNEQGMKRLLGANRVQVTGDSLAYVRFLKDFAAAPLTDVWTDIGGIQSRADPKIYVVQTATEAVKRCMLMTTDPGDLVLDPTCGSGTTAFVAEQWGRRWITCDSSRVALALAKHRLMTAKFDYQQLRPLSAEDVARNPHGTWLCGKDEGGRMKDEKMTFKCKTVPHITLKSIARNTSLDPIFAKHEPILAEKLARLNAALAALECGDSSPLCGSGDLSPGAASRRAGKPAPPKSGDESPHSKALRAKLVEKLIAKHRESGANAVTDADTRRWLLPDTQPVLIRSFPAKKPLKGLTPKQAEAYRAAIPKKEWKEWEVPFDTDADWPKPLADALTAYRAAWRAKMDEVNACISANAEMEELVDKPEPVKGVVRVSGPFSMEGVISVEDGPDTPIGGAPDELETFDGDAAVQNAEAHLDKIIRLLKASGVDFPGNKNMKFSRLDPISGIDLIHAEGEWMNGDQKERRAAVSIGPEIGNLSVWQVEEVVRTANRRGFDDLVFAAFGFDAAAQNAIEQNSHPKLRFHMALIRPDVAMGDLLKTQPGSQLFTVFSAPRVKGRRSRPTASSPSRSKAWMSMTR